MSIYVFYCNLYVLKYNLKRRNGGGRQRKEKFSEVDFAVFDGDPVGFEQESLHVFAAESKAARKPARSVDPAVARGPFGVGVDVQGVADRAGGAGVAQGAGDLSVSRHPSVRNGTDEAVNAFKKAFQNSLLCGRRRKRKVPFSRLTGIP